MTKKFLCEQIQKKRSYLCVGLDTDIHKIPTHFLSYDDPVFEFNKQIIEATHSYCIAYKANSAFYESRGVQGWESLEKTLAYIPKDTLSIIDAKRGDIGNTSAQYAKIFFEKMSWDAITLSPYMGYDSIQPFLNYKNKWVILLALTSNISSQDFQTLPLLSGELLFEKVIARAQSWSTAAHMMFVVGATRVDYMQKIRAIVPNHFLLVPGIGAQGGSLEKISAVGMNQMGGLIVHATRSILYAGQGKNFLKDVIQQTKNIQESMEKCLDKKNIS